jgi:hypothetical protein
MNNEGQYLVLMSNSDVRGNKQAEFVTHLSHKLRLGPQCMVSLVEASIPASWLTIPTDAKVHIKKTDGSSISLSLSPGYYADAASVIEALNITCLAYGVAITYDSIRNKIGVHRSSDVAASIYFDSKSSKMLGTINGDFVNLSGVTQFAKGELDLSCSVDGGIHVYLDIIESQLVGDSSSPLLRSIPVPHINAVGTRMSFEFAHRHYVYCSVSEFDTVSVVLRNSFGDIIDFCFGSVVLKLHFRAARNPLFS